MQIKPGVVGRAHLPSPLPLPSARRSAMVILGETFIPFSVSQAEKAFVLASKLSTSMVLEFQKYSQVGEEVEKSGSPGGELRGWMNLPSNVVPKELYQRTRYLTLITLVQGRLLS